MTNRRHFIIAAGLLPLLHPAFAADRRVVIVGGGWGGLAAARHVRDLAPGLDVTLVDRQPAFMSFALSNRWLVEPGAGPWARHDYARLAGNFGYRFVQAEVTGVDLARRRVTSSAGELPYDWLVLAPGIRENWGAWQVDDAAAGGALRRRYSGAMLSAADLPGLKQRLANFTGGDLLLTIPPAPYRCPPAPYERALFLAWWLKTRKIPGKLIIVDPNPIMPAFRNILLDRYKDQVIYLDHARVRRVDPERRTLSTEIDEIRFDEALLCPPQQAADLLWQAGLIRPEEGGKPSGWAAAGAMDFRSAADGRVFVIGDAIGLVSPQFGHFPKTGQVASRMGQAVARQIVAQATGQAAAPLLPESVCHVTTSVEPLENVRIETSYRDRGDGFLVQTVKQVRNPNPRGEDAAWAEAMYRDFLLP
ncbi:MAG: FAD-dependent oxidoreductase [Azonexus sp.]